MKVREIVEKLELEVVAEGSLDAEVAGVYVGDLLSNVMAKAKEKDLWLTVQGHQNVVAVAQLTGVAAIIVVEDFSIEDAAIKRAEEKNINLFRTSLTAYSLICKLIDLGI